LPPPDVAAPPPDAQVTPSGLAYRVLARGGGGRRPTVTARVLVNYTGWTTDGTIIDGAPIGGPPVTITLGEAMPGWQEGVRLMSRGDKFRFWIPASLAHAGAPGKPGGMLVYDIYLVDFND
jgi:peptidylprolyl isomerase